MSSHWHQSLICDNKAWKLDDFFFLTLKVLLHMACQSVLSLVDLQLCSVNITMFSHAFCKSLQFGFLNVNTLLLLSPSIGYYYRSSNIMG